MLYTRKGDSGTTKTFGCTQRVSKGSRVAEALGTLDECNSFLGFCKARLKGGGIEWSICGKKVADIVHDMQETLFIAQAELAGAPKKISKIKVANLEKITDVIEKELPPIHSFFIPGATELGALFDVTRTISRRAEREVTGACEINEAKISKHTRSYLNRLSSALYALARLTNHRSGIKEIAPSYK
jgi:cob(I)alamin adenosyltransferase